MTEDLTTNKGKTTMNNEIVVQDNKPSITALSVDEVVQHQIMIKEVVRGVMKKDSHYGLIPGTTKNVLHKPGAELLAVMFKLRGTYEVSERQLNDDHREFQVKCKMYRGEELISEGVGSCSTMESKYRYNREQGEAVGPVPKEYWDLKRTNAAKAQDIIGKGNMTVKLNADGEKCEGSEPGTWMVCKKGSRVEAKDVADKYNTVLKMAKKRAFLDAVITGTAASEYFTQDVDDFDEYIAGDGQPEQKAVKSEPVQPRAASQQAQHAPAPDGGVVYALPYKADGKIDPAEERKLLAAEGFQPDTSKKPWHWIGDTIIEHLEDYRVKESTGDVGSDFLAQDDEYQQSLTEAFGGAQ